jgi:hypothetical protein
MKRKGLAVLVMAIVFVLSAGVVQAYAADITYTSSTITGPGSYRVTLPDQSYIVTTVTTEDPIGKTLYQTGYPNSARVATVSSSIYSWLGIRLMTFTSRNYFAYRNNAIYSAYWRPCSTYTLPGVFYEGVTTSGGYQRWNNNAQGAYYFSTVGHFNMNLAGYPVRNYHLYHTVLGRSNGTYGWSTSYSVSGW